MKITRLEKVYLVGLAVVFGGIIIHAPLSVGLGVLFPDYGLLIKSWKEIVMVLLVPIASWVVAKRGLWQELLRDWIIRLAVLYAALHIILIPLSFDSLQVAAAGLAIDLRYVLYFVLVYVAVRTFPQWRKWFIRIGVVGAVVVTGFAVVQLFLPPDFLSLIGYSNQTIAPYLTVDKNPDYIRYSSTLRGPNPLGAYAVMVLALLVALWARGKIQPQWEIMKFRTTAWLLTLCTVIALWVSYSRSALVGAIVAVLLVVIVATGWKFPRRSWIAIVAIVMAIASGLFIARNTEFVSNVILHENPDGGSSISSNEGHIVSLQTGLERAIHQPLGVGIGSTGSASLFGDSPIVIENQYLFIAHETGWLGVGLFVVLFSWIIIGLWQRRDDWLALGMFASGIGLAMVGLLLPVWVDDTISIVWWGLAAVALNGGHDAKKTKQKAKRIA